MICRICNTEITSSEVSQFAAYGGLPSPCCNICFEVNDYTIKSLEELAGKSLLERVKRLNVQAELQRKLAQLFPEKKFMVVGNRPLYDLLSDLPNVHFDSWSDPTLVADRR